MTVPRLFVRFACLAALAWAAALSPWPAWAAAGDGTAESAEDEAYAGVLAAHEEERAQIEAATAALAEDPELEEAVLAYQDSLAASEEMAQHETAFSEALEQDAELERRLEAYEAAAAAEPEAEGELAAYDSLLAAEPELAERVQAVEEAAAADPEGAEAHAAAIAHLEAHPAEAESFFAEESGPVYAGRDAALVAYAAYLRAHPGLHRAWWRLHDFVRLHPRVARPVHRHWRWRAERTQLWRAGWRWRVYTAQRSAVHRIVWGRRLYYGRHPERVRWHWRHRLVVARRPHLRAQVRFLRQRPTIARAIAHHRHWVRTHRPVKPAPVRKRPPRAAPPPKPQKPRRR